MANTAIEAIDLATFFEKVHPFMTTMAGEVNGAFATNQPKQSSRWDEMINRLIRLRDLQEDWDGMGAKSPQAGLIVSAVELAQVIRQRGFPPPSRVGAGPDGEILLEWQADHVYLEAEISTPHSAEWMLAIDGQPPKHWITR